MKREIGKGVLATPSNRVVSGRSVSGKGTHVN